ncbi:MAG: pilus assembly protein N-terminal domain-containing protein, partial [Planctomycetaceae bacterium]
MHGDGTENSEQQSRIQLIQAMSSYDKPLHPMIEKLPDVEDELEVVHHRSQLIVARSNVLRTAVSDTSIIDVVPYSPNEIAVLGLSRGSTTLTIWFEDNPDPVVFLIKVIRDPSFDEQRRIDFGKLEQKLAVLFPNSRVYLIPLSYKIIVRGQARDSEEAAQILQIIRGEVLTQDGGLYRGQNGDNIGNADIGLADALVGGGGAAGIGSGGIANGLNNNNWASSIIVNMLEVPGDFQIMLHVKIAELNRSMLRRAGVDFDAILSEGSQAIGWVAGGTPANIAGLFENGEISVLINFLAANGTVKFLSEPTLTVMSGHTASFISGGEFAVPTIVGIAGAQGTSTTFRGFGTSLFVVPEVIDKDLIRMRITPEFSQTTEENSVNGIPGLATRRASTTVQMREGQTVALAGLYSHNMATQNNRIPLLGEIPWIGPILFNAKRATNDETELLILVTPEIVRPMEADEVPPAPGHEVTLPSDPELYRWGMTEGAPDTEVYQLAPYGYGSGTGNPVGYHLFNPGPSQPGYEPAPAAPFSTAPPPQNPYGSRYSPSTAIPGADGSEGWSNNGPPIGPAPGQGMRQEGWQQGGPPRRMAPPMRPQYQQPMP